MIFTVFMGSVVLILNDQRRQRSAGCRGLYSTVTMSIYGVTGDLESIQWHTKYIHTFTQLAKFTNNLQARNRKCGWAKWAWLCAVVEKGMVYEKHNLSWDLKSQSTSEVLHRATRHIKSNSRTDWCWPILELSSTAVGLSLWPRLDFKGCAGL